MIWDKGRRGESEDSSLALHSRKQKLCFVAALHLLPLPFHTPPAASESCALFIFACLIYKEVAFRCVQAKKKGLRLRHTEKPYMVKAEEFFKPFSVSDLFSLVVVIIVVTIRLYGHIVSFYIVLHLYTINIYILYYIYIYNSIRQMLFTTKALGMREPLGYEVLQEEM